MTERARTAQSPLPKNVQAKLEEIGKKLCYPGSSSFNMATEELTGGKANRGLFLHKLSSAQGECSAIEKLSLSTGEKIFFENYYSELMGFAPGLAPEVYHCEQIDKSSIHLFMEYLPPRTMDVTASSLRGIAHGVAAISRLHIRRAFFDPETLRITPQMLDEFADRIAGLERAPDLEQSRTFEFLGAQLPSLNDVTRKFTFVWCHNDLKSDHVLNRDAGSGSTVCFLDWGMFSPNFPGADFHFFVNEALRQNRHHRSISYMISEYCSELQRHDIDVEPRDAWFSACYFSLRQNIRWFNYFGSRVFMRNALLAAGALERCPI